MLPKGLLDMVEVLSFSNKLELVDTAFPLRENEDFIKFTEILETAYFENEATHESELEDLQSELTSETPIH